MSKEKTSGSVQTTLDRLPYGEAAAAPHGRIKNPKLPNGITNKMLMMDVIMIAWPSLLELILTQLTSIADQMMVGRMAGAAGVMGLTAVGLATQPKFLMVTLVIAMNTGCTAIIARFRGQQNREKANLVFKHAIILNMLIAVVMMVVGLSFSRPLISLMGGSGISPETLEQGVIYFNIQIYGIITAVLGITITAALRGIGDTRTPLIYNTIANVVNLGLNYLLIYGKFGFPEMGIAGASLATVIGQGVGAVIALTVALRKKRYIYLDLKEKFSFDKDILSDVVKIGTPTMVEQIFMRVGMMIFTRTVAGLGDTLYATHQVCMSIQGLTFMMGQAFANSATTLTGQSLGKRRNDMAILYINKSRQLGLVVSCVFGLLLVLLNEQLVAMYNDTPDVIYWGGQIMIAIAISQPFQSSQFIVAGGLRGAGDTKFGAIVMAVTVLGVRTSLGLLFINVLDFGLWGAWIALLADQLVRTALMLYRYKSGKWQNIRMSGDKAHAKA